MGKGELNLVHFSLMIKYLMECWTLFLDFTNGEVTTHRFIDLWLKKPSAQLVEDSKIRVEHASLSINHGSTKKKPHQ
jgi:hypothetical protein